MNSISIEIHCPKCWGNHKHDISPHLIRQEHRTVYVDCPHCGERLAVTYQVRGHVSYVKAASGLPQMWTLEGGT
jgi:uncharacterized Zn finger protein